MADDKFSFVALCTPHFGYQYKIEILNQQNVEKVVEFALNGGALQDWLRMSGRLGEASQLERHESIQVNDLLLDDLRGAGFPDFSTENAVAVAGRST